MFLLLPKRQNNDTFSSSETKLGSDHGRLSCFFIVRVLLLGKLHTRQPSRRGRRLSLASEALEVEVWLAHQVMLEKDLAQWSTAPS